MLITNGKEGLQPATIVAIVLIGFMGVAGFNLVRAPQSAHYPHRASSPWIRCY